MSGRVVTRPVAPAAGAPGWFGDALATPVEDVWAGVDGCELHALAWGGTGRRGLVFVHGGAAHAHWWTHVAAHFAEDLRVVAVDLSGHGDSDHRSEYALEQWTAEVMELGRAAGVEGAPIIVGHSMGGFVTMATAALHPDEVAGVIICDSPVTEPDPEVGASRLHGAFGVERAYADLEAAVARFRTVPAQEHYLDFVMDHVARRSLVEAVDGWRWKFDRSVFAQFAGGMRSIALPYLSSITCRLALLRSENGLVTRDIGEAMYERLGRVTPVIELPLAGHHPMLDEPLSLLTAIRTLLADWEHSEPHLR